MGSDALAQAGAGATAIEANRLAGSASGQEASFPGKKTDFRGFNRYEVATGKGTVSVVCPKHNLPGKPWMWRSMFWGGESRAVKRVTNSDLKLVEKGYHVVVAPGDVSGHPRGNAKIDAAYETLTKKYGFSKTVSMASMSRETLALFRWASVNPEKVESIYVDNGVCNVNSWPAGKLVPENVSKGTGSARSWTLFKKAYSFATDAEALASKESPIDLLDPLAKAGVPILMGCGTRDNTVPYEENGAIMQERYKALGGSIRIITEDKAHHPHGLEDMTPVVEFILENTSSIDVKQMPMSTVNAHDEGRPAQPNIVLLLTDDLGWQDVKCYDIDDPSPYETPNIDALAKKGAMFWQAYSPAPTCAPSRCAIMSGQHPARAQKTHVVGGAPPAPRNIKSQRMMDPWYSGRMPDEEVTLAEVLQTNGYTTGHSGKWHMAISHNAFPNAKDQGFDFTRASRGSRASMKDRLTGFATDKADDPFRMDANGYPFHQTNDDALTFLNESKDKPFFLYYATWLVHSPIHTRSEAHLKKYADRMSIDPAKTPKKATPGQQNPFYGAMVQELDYYVGQVFDYLDETEDPRWPGHMLSENTYVIFTSDNGGMEGSPKERYTDNNPLDRGKISAKEGGTRVPLIITGPGIAAGVQSNVMVNGLDFYPTILSLTGITKPENKILDGCDLKPLLLNDATDGSLVEKADGSTRDSMMWHFPHGVALESTLRIGDYKLIHNYDWRENRSTEEFELFRLYDSTGEEQKRVDIEESNNLASSMPQRTREMAAKLKAKLTEMQASYPYYNPRYRGEMPNKDRVCDVKSHQQNGTLVTFQYDATDTAKIVRADLIYTLNGNKRDEEWFRAAATIRPDGNIAAEIPEGTTHYFLNLVDENQFLRSYPDPVKKKKSYADSAIPAGVLDN